MKKHGKNISIKIYVNKIQNRITSKIKTEYYLKPLTPETMKSLGKTENKITKDENGKIVPCLETTEVVHYNIVSNDYEKIKESCIHLFLLNWLVS